MSCQTVVHVLRQAFRLWVICKGEWSWRVNCLLSPSPLCQGLSSLDGCASIAARVRSPRCNLVSSISVTYTNTLLWHHFCRLVGCSLRTIQLSLFSYNYNRGVVSLLRRADEPRAGHSLPHKIINQTLRDIVFYWPPHDQRFDYMSWLGNMNTYKSQTSHVINLQWLRGLWDI